MGEYLPYSGTNSIQEAVVGIHFPGMVSSDAVRQARDTAQAELNDVFPHLNETRMQEVKIEPERLAPQPGTPRLAGFELSKVRADAKPARILRFMENMLTVNFLEYQNWQTALEDSLKYIRTVLSPVMLVTNPVVAFSLRYIDRYTFDGSHDEPRAGTLLRKGNEYMASRCFEVGPLWHCHSGWFESLDAGDSILNQLNVGSAIVDGVSTVTIDHNAICQLRAPRQTIESIFQPPSGESTGLENVLDFLHDRNSTILKNMLLPEMLERIGLLG